MKRSASILVVATALAGVVAAASPLASPGAPAAKARIAIEAKGYGGQGTFSYRDRNDVVKDSGWAADAGGPAFFHGKKGTFYIKWRGVDFNAGSDWTVSTGNWSFAGGTGKYAGIRGGGRFAMVRNLDLHEFVRFEGLVTGGP